MSIKHLTKFILTAAPTVAMTFGALYLSYRYAPKEFKRAIGQDV